MNYKAIALTIIVSLISQVTAEDKITPETNRHLTLKEYCINGHAFVVAISENGLSITQVLISHGYGNPPQPKKCQQKLLNPTKKNSFFS